MISLIMCQTIDVKANHRVRSHEEETLQRQREAQALQDQQKRLLAAEKARREAFDKHSLVERKTALNLVQFAQKSRNFDLDPDRVENLISTLIVCVIRNF